MHYQQKRWTYSISFAYTLQLWKIKLSEQNFNFFLIFILSKIIKTARSGALNTP